MHRFLETPPPTPIESVTDVVHGVPVVDSYRWLEEQSSPRTRKWLEQQTAYSRTWLDAIPGRDQMRKRLVELLDHEVISEPWKVGNRYFFVKRPPAQEQPIIMLRDGDEGRDISLVNPAEEGRGNTTAVNILCISKDARLLAFSVRSGGEDSCVVRILDVNSKKVLRDYLPRGFFRGLAFAPNGHGFYYSHETMGAPRPYSRAIYYHELGTQSREDTELFFAGDDSCLRLLLFSSSNGQRLGYCTLCLGDPKRTDFLLHNVAAGLSPQPIVTQMEGRFIPFLLEPYLIALTDWKAPNFRVVLINPDRPEPQNWTEIVPERESRIQNIVVTDKVVLVSSANHTGSIVDAFSLSGRILGQIPLPSKGTATLFPCRQESDTVFFQFTSFNHPPTIFRYHTHDGHQSAWATSQLPIDPSSICVEQIQYASKDGTQVPMLLVCKKNLSRSGPLPTFLSGYGGFGRSITPRFTAYGIFLMEQGFLLAIANLRGGAEFGETWHEAGKRHKRQNAFDDFIAAAEWLLAQGRTVPGRLAIGGGSNAGLLVGAAFTQRPELFRAVICLGPLLDMLRYHKFDQARLWVEEYGCADNADDFPYLLAYSPYHHVRDHIAYPAVMLISGDADLRCNSMHARKMVARLQATTCSGHPILLDHTPTWGHTPVQPFSKRIEALADRLSFICHELGVTLE